MLRGLLVRRALGVIDVTLAAFVLLTGGLTIAKVFQPSAGLPTKPPTENMSAGGEEVGFARLRPLEEYQVILANKLFGDGAQYSQAAQPEPPISPESLVKETTEALRLRGTSAAYPLDPLGSAIIERLTDDKGIDTYYLGQPVTESLTLVEIYKAEVIFENKLDKTREILRMEKETTDLAATSTRIASARLGASQETGPARGPAGQYISSRSDTGPQRSGRSSGSRPGGGPGEETPSSAGRPALPGQGGQIVVSKADVMQDFADMYARYPEVVEQVRPTLYTDSTGKVAGITGSNLSRFPLAHKLGLQEGDVIQQVNGVTIDSDQRIFEILNRFQHSPVFHVSILRGGRPQTLTYRIE